MNKPNILEINTDGGSRGNPGPSACAFVIKNTDKLIEEKAFYLGINTNNYAEYLGVLMAFEYIHKNIKKFFYINTLNFFLDSELVVRQLNGVYKIKSQNIIPIFLKIKKLANKLNIKINYIHVRRDKNTITDFLVNKILDENI